MCGDTFSRHDPLNWTLDTRIPNACEDVTIASDPNVTVDHSEGDSGALRVLSQFPLDISGGTLAIRDTLQVNADLTFLGGTLAGATLIAPSIAAATAGAITPANRVTFTTSAGTLDGVTMNAPMDLLTVSSRVDIAGDLVLNDTASLGNNAQIRYLAGTQVLTGTGQVVFTSAGPGFVTQIANTDLTIDSGITIRGMGGQAGTATTSATLANRGAIASDQTGRITIRGGGG